MKHGETSAKFKSKEDLEINIIIILMKSLEFPLFVGRQKWTSTA